MSNELSITDQKNLSTYFVGALDSTANLPDTVDKQRLALNFISLLQDKPELKKFGAEILAPMVVRCAKDNLDVLNQEVYIYEGYGGKLTYTPSYRGLRKMAIQKSIKPIKEITAKSIFEGDTLDEEYINGQAHLNYKSDFMKRGKWIGTFCVVLFQDGSEMHEIMNMDDINAVKAKSKNSGAWKDFPQEMAKKAIIRRISKQITMDFSDNEQANVFNGTDEFIDDPKEQAEKDIADNANQKSLDDEVVAEVVVDESGQQTFVTEG